eukprot:Gb_12314 [translate_table: standard]
MSEWPMPPWRSYPNTSQRRLDFTCDDLLECLRDNIIGKGGAGIVYKDLMPRGDEVTGKRLPGTDCLDFALTMKRIYWYMNTCSMEAWESYFMVNRVGICIGTQEWQRNDPNLMISYTVKPYKCLQIRAVTGTTSVNASSSLSWATGTGQRVVSGSQQQHGSNNENFMLHKVVPVMGDITVNNLGIIEIIREDLLDKLEFSNYGIAV